MSDARTRLLALAAEKGVSLTSLSAMIGRNPTYLQQFVRKGSPRRLEESDRGRLARFFGVAEQELGSGRDSVEGPAFAPPAAELVSVPRLAVEASAGPGALAEAEVAVGALHFERGWLRALGLDGRPLSTIAVKGDSMEPTLREGDEILVDTTARAAASGVHVVRIDGAVLVKRLVLLADGQVSVNSDNPAYAPLVRPCSAVHVLGRVVWRAGCI